MRNSLKKAINYYDIFAQVYDLFSPKWYYHEARDYSIKQLQLKEGDTILNLPCGTGQNFEYIQEYINNTGLIIGIDLSDGMLRKAKRKVNQNDWKNIHIIQEDATKVNTTWLATQYDNTLRADVILCDLGLSGFPAWEKVIDNLYELLAPQGRLVIMDWYLPKPTLRGELIKWIGKGEVDRPIYQYLQSKTNDFSVNTSFNRGGVFVATGIKS
ncbi:methyltransferase domain-containing protein [uncultured Arcticibacterium sp.]|jgi:ubiquinone/menaquinone biosynthesis C-methylase UbiE|uniref:class I SAM-dependent methyltransferase n=1 Tax=uncultured Arcticibacterium sp. TaxID=2173042 RepID=UPI0030FCC3B6